ncbi:MAG TPA: MBL fold metallo-hydrolase [Tepidisphaeraceae bacterium]|jgi:metallo-beta-lactamase family protein|nr:MBL fold metallo-hydrolase [Tepidisphaeraceae bacterium]
MRIQFCGADRTVTGSSHLIEVNGLRIFLDMGLYQGPRDEARRINLYLPADVKSADAIILSHGHLDHCGKLPVALRHGFAGPIYCTPATAEVARIVLEDSARIQQEDIEYINRRCREPGGVCEQALYGPRDIPAVLKAMRHVDYGKKTDLGKGVSFTFLDAGHILGSAYVILEWAEGGQSRSLLFTADVGRYDAPILRDPQPIPGPVDLLITESTYGNASHGPMAAVEPQFLDAVKNIIGKQSRLIVPSFAVGRTQTMLWYLEKFIHEKSIPQIPIFVDSPMGVEVSKVHSKFSEIFDTQTKEMIGGGDLFSLAKVTFASSIDESKRINNQRGPCVIIASSPTCEFGRVLHHLQNSVENPNDMVLFCGWIPPQTLGRRIQDGEKRLRIYDRWYDLRCQVRTIHGLSAHADGDELLRFLSPTLVAKTEAFVVHGEVPQAEGFAARLIKAGIGRASVPAMETSVVSFTGDIPVPPSRVPGRTDQD